MWCISNMEMKKQETEKSGGVLRKMLVRKRTVGLANLADASKLMLRRGKLIGEIMEISSILGQRAGFSISDEDGTNYEVSGSNEYVLLAAQIQNSERTKLFVRIKAGSNTKLVLEVLVDPNYKGLVTADVFVHIEEYETYSETINVCGRCAYMAALSVYAIFEDNKPRDFAIKLSANPDIPVYVSELLNKLYKEESFQSWNTNTAMKPEVRKFKSVLNKTNFNSCYQKQLQPALYGSASLFRDWIYGKTVRPQFEIEAGTVTSSMFGFSDMHFFNVAGFTTDAAFAEMYKSSLHSALKLLAASVLALQQKVQNLVSSKDVDRQSMEALLVATVFEDVDMLFAEAVQNMFSCSNKTIDTCTDAVNVGLQPKAKNIPPSRSDSPQKKRQKTGQFSVAKVKPHAISTSGSIKVSAEDHKLLFEWLCCYRFVKYDVVHLDKISNDELKIICKCKTFTESEIREITSDMPTEAKEELLATINVCLSESNALKMNRNRPAPCIEDTDADTVWKDPYALLRLRQNPQFGAHSSCVHYRTDRLEVRDSHIQPAKLGKGLYVIDFFKKDETVAEFKGTEISPAEYALRKEINPHDKHIQLRSGQYLDCFDNAATGECSLLRPCPSSNMHTSHQIGRC